MPAYNHEKFVGEAIESVLNQTFKDYEFIIINDGSTDKTENTVKKFKDSRIKYFYHDNIGAPQSINKGLQISKGKYISIINSDDLYHPERLSYLYSLAESQTLLFLFTDIIFIDQNSNQMDERSHHRVNVYNNYKSRYLKTKSILQTFLFGNLAFTTSNFFFNSSLIEDVGNFSNHHYTHDYEYVLRCIKKHESKIDYASEKKYLYYRSHGDNAIDRSGIDLQLEIEEILTRMLPEFLKEDEHKLIVEATLERLKLINNMINQELIKTKNSISWKITKPLRWLPNKLLLWLPNKFLLWLSNKFLLKK